MSHNGPEGSDFAALWDRVIAESPFPVPEGLGPALALYREELIRFNTRINLIRYADDRELAARHFLDSLAALAFIPQGARLADLGSGAGFPGVVIAVARPDVHVTAVESIGKKADFLRQVRRRLKLNNVEVIGGRWEAVDLDRFDLLVTRAAAPPAVLISSLAEQTRRPILAWTADDTGSGECATVLFRYALPGETRARRAILRIDL